MLGADGGSSNPRLSVPFAERRLGCRVCPMPLVVFVLTAGCVPLVLQNHDASAAVRAGGVGMVLR